MQPVEEAKLHGVRRDLAIGLAAAAVVRIVFLWLIDRVVDMADAVHYANMARQFAAGDFLHFDENLPILYSALAASVHVVVPHWEWSFWIVSLLASSLTIIPVYLLVLRLHGVTSARVATGIVVCWPWLVDYGSRIAPDALAVFLWLSAAYLIVVAVERGTWRIPLLLLTLVALHLARPEGTFLMLVAPAAALCVAWGQPRERIARVLVIAVGCVLLLGLYALLMRNVVGTYTVSYRAPMGGDVFDYLRRGGIEGARTFMHLTFNVLPVMIGPVLLIFAGIGMYSDFPPRAPRAIAVLAVFCAVQWMLTVANFSPAPRYIMSIVIVFSFWSAHGIVVATRAVAARKRIAAPLPAALVAASLLAGMLATVLPERGDTPRLPREYKIAGTWMRQHLEPGFIICRKPQVGFYAEMPTTGPAPGDSPEELMARAREIGARYLVLDERYTAQLSPRLKPLLDPGNAPDGLTLHRDDLSPYPNARVVVYEFTEPGIVYATNDDFTASTSHMGPDRRRRIQ